jgi:hypothetical protein
MPTRLFSTEELTRLRSFPAEVSRDEVIRYFTLTEPDRALVARAHGEANQLGLAVQVASPQQSGGRAAHRGEHGERTGEGTRLLTAWMANLGADARALAYTSR